MNIEIHELIDLPEDELHMICDEQEIKEFELSEKVLALEDGLRKMKDNHKAVLKNLDRIRLIIKINEARMEENLS